MSSSIGWNGEYFVLINDTCGNAFVYAYSMDGLNWTKSQFPPNITVDNPYSVKYIGDNNYAIYGNVTKTIVSASGNTTITNSIVNIVDKSYPVAIPNNFPNGTVINDIESNLEQPHRIVFPRSVAIALGAGSKIAYSVDQGSSWTASPNASSIFSASANDTVWNGTKWVAVGSGSENTIATSLDGISWTGRGNYVFSSSCNGVDWSDQQNQYLAIGSGPNIVASSKDGVHWLGTNTSLFAVGNDIKWNGKMWVAVGTPLSGNGTIAYSLDGVSWQYASQSFNQSGVRVFYNDNESKWIVFGQDSAPYNLATSSDGVSWVLSNDAGATALMMNMPTGQFPDPSMNMYPGVPYPLKTVNNAVISSVSKYAHNHSDRGCAQIQPISIACGEGATSMAYSVDGIEWVSLNNSLFTTRCNKAVWNGTVWVAVGAGNYWVATSADGISWTGRNSAILTECYDVAWNGSWFVAVGQGASSRIAKSQDGITWESVSESVFSTKVHAIEWTGLAWLVYGSGSNTTGISLSSNASSWSATAVPNLCTVDNSSIISGNLLDVSASSVQGSDVPSNVVDGSFNAVITKWSSQIGNYSAVDGSYIGANTTTYNTNQSVTGEWLQIDLSASLTCKNYYAVFQVDGSNSIPKSWRLLGSNDGVAWNSLDTFNYATSSPPNNSWKYPFVSLPLSISSNVAAYSKYRIVFTSSFGADFVHLAELQLFDGGSQATDRYIRPLVLKDCILHPTRILSVDGVTPNVYRITDLCGNLIRNGYVHGQHVNNVVYGLTAAPAAAAFDGQSHIVGSITGEVSYLSNLASITNLNFDNSLNGLAVQSGINGAINAACYNRKYLLVGGAGGAVHYGTLNAYADPVFYSTNATELFTTVYGLASNSGYGFVVPPNTIYLQEDDRLSIITPKYYDSALSPETSISFNVYKA